MPRSKEMTEHEGLKVDGPVEILVGPNTTKVEEVRQLGVVGFLVKTRSVTYYWYDKNVTWRPVNIIPTTPSKGN
jgi:hypothetical protein